MTQTDPRLSIAAFALAASVLLATASTGYVTHGLFTDHDTAETTVTTADSFPAASPLPDAHQLRFTSDALGANNTLDGGVIRWWIEVTGPNTLVLVIESRVDEPQTFAIEQTAVLDSITAGALASTTLTLEDGSPLDVRVETIDGTEWLVFTLEHFSTREVVIQGPPPAVIVQSVGGAADPANDSDDDDEAIRTTGVPAALESESTTTPANHAEAPASDEPEQMTPEPAGAADAGGPAAAPSATAESSGDTQSADDQQATPPDEPEQPAGPPADGSEDHSDEQTPASDPSAGENGAPPAEEESDDGNADHSQEEKTTDRDPPGDA